MTTSTNTAPVSADIDALEAQLAAELKASVDGANERARPAVSIACWPNTRRDPAKNHAHFTGRVTLNVMTLGEMLANAIKDEKSEIELWVNVWHNPTGSTTSQGTRRPTLSGNASRLVTGQSEASNESGADQAAPAATHETSNDRPM